MSQCRNLINLIRFSVVVILCFLSTITTAFEYQLDVDTKYYDRITGELCPNYTEPSSIGPPPEALNLTAPIDTNDDPPSNEFIDELEFTTSTTPEPIPCTTDVWITYFIFYFNNFSSIFSNFSFQRSSKTFYFT